MSLTIKFYKLQIVASTLEYLIFECLKNLSVLGFENAEISSHEFIPPLRNRLNWSFNLKIR